MKKWIAALVVVTFGLSSFCVAAQSGPTDGLRGMTREELHAELNENYYAYINFERFLTDEIPYGENACQLAEDWTIPALKEDVLGFIAGKDSYAPGTNERTVADFYEQFLDENAREQVGIEPFSGVLAQIENAQDIGELLELSATLQTDYGVESILPFYVRPGIFDSSRYTLALKQMQMPVTPKDMFTVYGTADNLQASIKRVLEMRGAQNAGERAFDATEMLMEIAEQTIPEEELFYEAAQIKELSYEAFLDEMPAASARIFDALGIEGEGITVLDGGQFLTIARLLDEKHLQCWKDYLLAQTLFSYAYYLPGEYAGLFSALGGGALPATERNALEQIYLMFYRELAYPFARKYADEETLLRARELTADIIAAYGKLMENSPDIDGTTRARFMQKLENMQINIDIPREPYDGGYVWVPAEQGGGLLANMIAKNAGEFQKNLAQLGKPFDKSAFGWDEMPPQTFGNAMYHTANYVTIPYATLTPPYFDKDGDYYENLGCLGAIIGHEISHGFDNTCMQFDENGNWNPAWIGEDYARLLEQKKAGITELYDGKKLFGIYPLDGEKTLGENMADLAGVQCILSMAKTKEQKRTVLESYARIWYTLMYDDAAFEQLYGDEHALNEFRVNVVLSQMDEFYEVYGIRDGAMYTAPADRKRVW